MARALSYGNLYQIDVNAVSKVNHNKNKKVTSFYNLSDYEAWKEETENGKGFSIKYYKGLGTSTPKEAKEYFRDLKMVNYVFEPEKVTRPLSWHLIKSWRIVERNGFLLIIGMKF